EQVVVHFGPGEGLAELGDELPLPQVAGQDLQLLEVVGRRLAHQVTARTLFAVLVQALANHFVDRFGLLRVLDVGSGEALIGVGRFPPWAVGGCGVAAAAPSPAAGCSPAASGGCSRRRHASSRQSLRGWRSAWTRSLGRR